jgi:SAM-dependent methyltransferase
MFDNTAPKDEFVMRRLARRCIRLSPRLSAVCGLTVPEHHAPSLLWKLGRLLIASSKDHAFLDRAWISGMLRVTPKRLRAPLAMRLLSLSPHYWVYQWTGRYPVACTREQVLRAEYLRNAASRKEICDKLLRRFLRPEMTVLDFGCGPGFLAKEVSAHVAHVVACDVSRGVIACAKQINGADNLRYVANGLTDLEGVPTESVDLAYSFAVFQHLTKAQSLAFFREFARVLKPGATGACHTILKESGELRAADPSAGGWMARRVNLRMVYFTAAEIAESLQRAGLRDVNIIPIASLADIRDDIGNEQLVTFRR